MGQVIDFERFKLHRTAGAADCHEAILPWSSSSWPFCRVRYFVRTSSSGQPPRCCCGRTYNSATLQARAPVFAAIVREALSDLSQHEGVTVSGLVAAVLARREVTSVERAALSTGPCASCPTLAEQTQQLRFLWGLYRAYWKRATGSAPPRNYQGQLAVQQARQSAVGLRDHIRHEISLIRHLQRQLAGCPWARRRQLTPAGSPSLAC